MGPFCPVVTGTLIPWAINIFEETLENILMSEKAIRTRCFLREVREGRLKKYSSDSNQYEEICNICNSINLEGT